MKALVAWGRSGELGINKCNTPDPLQSKHQGIPMYCRAEAVPGALSTSAPVSKFHCDSNKEVSLNALQNFDIIAGQLYDNSKKKMWILCQTPFEGFQAQVSHQVVGT